MLWFPHHEQRDFLWDAETECTQGWRWMEVNHYYNAFSFCVSFFLNFFLFVLEQIENIDACLSFLAAKGINIQGLSAEGESIDFLRFHVK